MAGEVATKTGGRTAGCRLLEKRPVCVRGWRGAACAVVAVHVLLLAYGATRTAPTHDETGHMVAGLSHYEFGRMELYRVNPPLVRLIATFPVWLAGPETDWEGWFLGSAGRPEFPLGWRFIAANGTDSLWYFTLARWACIPFSIVGALVCRRWAAELYGELAGFLALCLWCFSPNLLAHAQLITPDVPAASVGILALYWFRTWLIRPSAPAAALAGIFLGLALGTKTTWILLFALYPGIWLVHSLYRAAHFPLASEPSSSPGSAWGRTTGWLRRPSNRLIACHRHSPHLRSNLLQLAIILVVGLYTTNSLYGFQGAFRRLDSFAFDSRSLSGQGVEDDRVRPGNRFSGTLLGKLPVPLPEDLVVGADRQKAEFDRRLPAYLAGTLQEGGWWYYYLYAMAVKLPLGTLLLLAISGLAFLWKRSQRDEWLLLLLAGVLTVTVSSQTGINKHLRYMFPAFPMLFILATRCAAAPASRWFKTTASACTAATIIASLSVYPYSMSFFNSAAGGPERGAEHLLNSNISWGQDVLELIEWSKRHPDRRPLYCALHVNYDPKDLGLDYHVPPEGLARNASDLPHAPPPGWYAIDVNFLYGYPYPIPTTHRGRTLSNLEFWTQFRQRNPQQRIGYSIHLYKVAE